MKTLFLFLFTALCAYGDVKSHVLQSFRYDAAFGQAEKRSDIVVLDPFMVSGERTYHEDRYVIMLERHIRVSTARRRIFEERIEIIPDFYDRELLPGTLQHAAAQGKKVRLDFDEVVETYFPGMKASFQFKFLASLKLKKGWSIDTKVSLTRPRLALSYKW